MKTLKRDKEIPERKGVEERLLENNAFIKGLFASMKDGFSILDNHGIHIDVNDALCLMTGFAREELIGVGPPHPYWPEEEYEKIQTAFQKTLRGEFGEFELVFKGKNGERFPVIVSSSWLKDNDGNITCYFVTVEDVTERKILEERYSTIIQTTLEGFFLSTLEGNILDVNDAFCRMLGYSRDEILSMTACDFDIELMGTLENLKRKILEVKAKGGAFEEVRHRCKDGRIIDVSISIKYLDPGHFFCFHRDVTEQKRVRQQLRESEEKLRLLFEALPEGITTLDADGNILGANKATARMYGYDTEEEIIGLSIFEFVAKKDRTRVKKIMRRTLQEGPLGAIELKQLRRDGSEFTIEVNGAVIKDKYGNPAGFITITEDITERKRLENQLKESEERYRSLIELGDRVGEAVVMLQDVDGKEGTQTFVSDEWLNITGYSRKELLSMSFFDLLNPVYRKDSIERHQKKMKGDSLRRHFEMSVIRKDGREVPIEITSGYTVYQGKQANVAYIRDISERKKTEKIIVESESKLRSILSSMDDLVFVFDREGRFVTVHPSTAKKLYKYQDEFIGKKHSEVMPAKINELFTAAFDKNKVGEVADYEYPLDVNGGTRWFHAKLSPIVWDGKFSGSVAVVRDITERKKIQEGIIKAEAQTRVLQESERMKTELLSMVSHELRTPLASIKGFASTLLQSDIKWGEEERKDFICEIDIAADRLSRLVDDLLDMSSIEAGTLSLDKDISSINEILGEAKPMLARISEQHVLKIKTASKLPPVIVDKGRLIQVLSNLVNNAVKFSPKGSQITIEANRSKDEVVISVADEGIGIPEGERANLFDRFYHAKKITTGVKRGTGLGLAICRGLVGAHGGKIWLDSQEDRGSTFYFSLPICQAD